MADAGEGSKADAEIERPRTPRVRSVWGIGYIKRKRQEHIARKKEEATADKAARITATATKWMAFFTFVLALVTGGTYLVLRSQLREMRGGGIDTHELATAAGKQADEAKAQVGKLAESVAKTDDLIRQASDQAKATNRLAAQAKRSADIAQRTLEVSERPWVGVTAITLTDNVEVGKVLAAKFTAQNSGRTPAIHVKTTFRLNVLCEPLPSHPHPDYTVSTPASISMLLPNLGVESTEVKSSQPITEELMALLRSNSSCDIYGFALVTYDDTFGRTHWRHACGFWQKGTPKVLLSCQAYNDGDEDYPDGKEPN